ncbi:hypothetical protein DBT_0042 [Dissulfuribacter thermophilus]|uniref:Uncharacterized protein n=1 Tax=Dissulfuribacter thermophilus TaxID=1156395 RepID=A0A1B9F8S9_9BACT|nr:hypothetical protein DBT_0042 [Dissulfuribacter thermophilus]
MAEGQRRYINFKVQSSLNSTQNFYKGLSSFNSKLKTFIQGDNFHSS